MKKLLITLLAVTITRGAWATASNDDATSKLYVDTTVATRQDTVDTNDANTVMTYTDIAGTVGTKAIYDSTGSYAEQQNALVSADVANAAIMNAINMEFTCAEYNPNDATDCWKWSINTVPISTLPTGYKGLEYLSMKNNFVRCNWNPTRQTYKVKTKFRFNSLSVDKYNAIFGADDGVYFGVSRDGYWSPHTLHPNNSNYTNISIRVPITVGTWYIAEDILDRRLTSNNISGSINGIQYTGNRRNSSDNYVWTIGNFSSVTTLYESFDGDIAYIQVYENDILIHDYVPAQYGDLSGMYDTVSNQFFPIGNAPIYLPNN